MPVESLNFFISSQRLCNLCIIYAKLCGQLKPETWRRFFLLICCHCISSSDMSIYIVDINNYAGKNKMKYITIVRCLLDVKQ